jgi:L-lactate dehydrogenase complex protein LldG
VEREAFLARVRAAVDEATVPAASYTPGPLVADLGTDDLAERFRRNLEAVDGVVLEATGAEEAIGLLGEILDRHGAEAWLGWESAELPVAGLAEALDAGGRVRLGDRVPEDGAGRIDHQMEYFDVVAGITGADAGLAESGSIVVETRRGRARMASLIPLVHIALLRRDAIVPSLSHWVADHPDAAADTANLIVITGPSRTGDIEMQLNLGVHGPKHLYVVLLPAS